MWGSDVWFKQDMILMFSYFLLYVFFADFTSDPSQYLCCTLFLIFFCAL